MESIATTPIEAPWVRNLLKSYAPRVAFTEEKGLLSSRFTISGDEPYLSRAVADVKQHIENGLIDNFW